MKSLTSNGSDRPLAQLFAKLCAQQSALPDVFEFLGKHPDARLEEKAAICLMDQSHRWRSGEGILVEKYLEMVPELNADSQAKVILIVAEFRHLCDQGMRPVRADVLSRFPDIREELHGQLPADDHNQVAGGLPSTEVQGDGCPEETDAPEHEARDHTHSVVDSPSAQPEQIGRYRVQRILGDGGFGRVYLAFDVELRRSVAIKVPHEFRIASPDDIETYFDEARILARLDHPAIVPVYDFGRTDTGNCYTVAKYIEGSDLAAKAKRVHFSFAAAAELITVVAEALHYSHLQGVVHRDVKPANILIDTENRPYITDFGIALKEEDFGKDRPTAGTPAYMSPEQARLEGHLVDGRSDIFSLGVVFYELLSGRRPFKRRSSKQMATVEARPLRQIDDSIPEELERICLKALSYRVTERYFTARDMADDLRHFVEHGAELDSRESRIPRLSSSGVKASSDQLLGTGALTIVPKGLRSFDRDDAGFFLELLPGARDRDGLPESVRFWKTRILEEDSEKSFRVGLVYGPSGCGKSSFLKAAVIPNLPDKVIPIYVESTLHETEMRLLKALRKLCPNVPRDLDLPGTLAALRRGRDVRSGTEVLIVLDQFEQWLHSRHEDANGELVRALRQCDGSHLKCIVAVRDDFWMAVTHFMEDLEVSLIPDRNILAIDLFNTRHARKVLTAMGRAYGALPPGHEQIERPHELFILRAIDDLAHKGQVVPVHLSLFAEMIKDKPWVHSTLQALGGAEGVGVTFLEETFNGRTANPHHRLHQKGARAVLAMLLSDRSGDIRGGMRSYQELLGRSGYENQKSNFDVLLRILDSELRLITPTDPAGLSTEGDQSEAFSHEEEERYYHLTHDYLVPSIKEWLSLKKKETWRGRAELLLSERAHSWQARPSNRALPSFMEWLRILAWTSRRNRAHLQAEQQMMQRAGPYYLTRIAIAAILFMGVGWWIYESIPRMHSRALIDSLQSAASEDVPAIIERLSPVRRWADPLLVDALRKAKPDSRAYLHLSLALLPIDGEQQQFLFQCMLKESPETLSVINGCLLKYIDRAVLADQLWSILEDTNLDSAQRFRAGAALAVLGAFDPGFSARGNASATFLAEELVRRIADNQNQFAPWTELLFPARGYLMDHLKEIYTSTSHHESDRHIAAAVLAEYALDRPELLVDLLLIATPQQHRTLFPKLESHVPDATSRFRSCFEAKPPAEATPSERSRAAKRRAHAAALLFASGNADPTWQSLAQSEDPELAAFLENRISSLIIHPEQILHRLLATASDRLRASLLRTLGGIDASDQRELRSSLRDECLRTFESAYRDDPDSGVHSAAAWALRRWGIVFALNSHPKADRNWYITGQGQTMIIIDGPVKYQIGSPPVELGRGTKDEWCHPMRIDRSFALSAAEVTIEQYIRFQKNYRFVSNPRAPDPQCPAVSVNWVEAAEYCRWLCEQENIPPAEWCYPQDIEIEIGMELPKNFLDRPGYRLPTEAEWEYACRAGSAGRYCFGNDAELLRAYAWFQDNARGQTWPVGSLKPNPLGLFDMHGNVQESCHNIYWHETKSVDTGETRPLRKNSQTVSRGGSYASLAGDLRSANRRGDSPTARVGYAVGFRVARTYHGR